MSAYLFDATRDKVSILDNFDVSDKILAWSIKLLRTYFDIYHLFSKCIRFYISNKGYLYYLTSYISIIYGMWYSVH